MVPLFTVPDGIRVVLASGSPRRQQFLQEWGIPFTVRKSVAEPESLPGEKPEAYALRSASAKLADVHPCRGELVIAADTVVTIHDRILGKPSSDEDALHMLEELAGARHAVVTAVALSLPDGTVETFADTTEVEFLPWERPALQAYVATGECRDKAGAYAIQGQGAFLIKAIYGSWSTVVGLPLNRLSVCLVRHGVLAPR